MTESIGNLNDLEAIRSIVNGGLTDLSYALAADIDMSGIADWMPIGTSGSKFEGQFNGKGFVISGLTIPGISDSKALFGYTSYADFIELAIINASVSGDDNLALLVAYDYRSNYFNCYTSGTVTGGSSAKNLGSLVGYSYGGIYSYCHSSGTVHGGGYTAIIGGMIGRANACEISRCYCEANVSIAYGGNDIGGLVGLTDYGTVIEDSFATGNVSGLNNTKEMGGLVGQNSAGCTVIRCHATGAVGGNNCVTDIGALVGNQDGTVTDCYYNSTTTGQGGAGTAVADSDYTNEASFPAFDFGDVWIMGDDGPALQAPKPEIAKKLTFVISTDRICKPHGFFMIG